MKDIKEHTPEQVSESVDTVKEGNEIMEQDIKESIILLRRAMSKVINMLEDCPDKQEGKFLSKAAIEMNNAMEFLVSAKNLKSDSLEPRQKLKR
jgi:hypothetical protein